MTPENSPRNVARAPLEVATLVVGHTPSHYRQNEHLQEWRMVTNNFDPITSSSRDSIALSTDASEQKQCKKNKERCMLSSKSPIL